MKISISPNFVRGFVAVTGAYALHRILKAVYRRGCDCKKPKRQDVH